MSATSAAATTETSFQDHVNDVVAGLRDEDQWFSLDSSEILLLLYHGLCTYGVTNDESMVPLLMPVYGRAMEITDRPDRMELYNSVKTEVENRYVSLNALLPFLLVDRDAAIVSIATIDVAMMGRPYDDDPLSRPRTLVSYIKRGSPSNRGAVLGGLILLGDRRVNQLLDEIKWTLSDSEVQVAATRHSGLCTLAAFKFWLSRAEELLERSLTETSVYAHCTSALALFVRGMRSEFFFDVERNFGYMHQEPDADPMEIIERLSVQDVMARFASRLYAIEAEEPSPKVMSHILLQYGLEPRAARADRYVSSEALPQAIE